MKTKADAQSLQIELKVGEYITFLLILSKDGSIQRFGPVDPGGVADLKMCVVKEPLFSSFMQSVPEYVFTMLDRRFACSDDVEGEQCALLLTFADGAGGVAGVRFDYGSHSKGPPDDLMAIIAAARKLTDDWYNAQADVINTDN